MADTSKAEAEPAGKAGGTTRRKGAKGSAPKAPKRPTLDAETVRLLAARATGDGTRPKFTRQASYRYWRIGRDGAWRSPRGLQSKQRRHYKYRSAVVRIGYRGPAKVRGRTPSGFRPVLVSTAKGIAALVPATDAAIIARTVGTKRRLVLEETARKAGVHVLNPITRDAEE